MKKRARLTSRSDFQRLLSGRRLFAGASLVAFAAAGSTAATRVGVSASRQIRGSVARNRVRRRLREAARLEMLRDGSILKGPGITYDVVLIARPAAVKLSFSRIEADLREFSSGLELADHRGR